MLAKTLRDDQTLAIHNVREAVGRGEKRVVVQGPTGMGKTVLIADIVNRARAKNKRVVITVPAISLIDQTVIALRAQGILDEVGVIQAQNQMTDWSKPVQVASVQTLDRRWKDCKEGKGEMPRADVVLVDEVHRMFTLFSEWMVHPDWLATPFVGFSATPWTKGLGMLYARLLAAGTIKDLTARGVLVPFRTFAPDTPDLTGVRSQVDTTGVSDFVAGDLDEVMRVKKLVANIVETWKRLADDRPTVCFCCSRAHADQVAREFEEAGVGAAYLQCDTPLPERAEARRALMRGEIKVITNVDVIGIGVDIPELSCVIYARPTKSDIRFVQNVGRGLRACEGKTDLLILDHSSTTQRLGFVDDVYGYHNALDDGRSKPPAAQGVLLPKECPKCHLLKPPRVAVCPHCGHKVEAHANPVLVERGSLREYKPGDDFEDLLAALKKKIPDSAHVFGQLVWWGRKKGYNQWWPNMKFKEMYGVRFPRFKWEDKVSAPVPELLEYIYKSNERFKEDQRKLRRRTNGNGAERSGALTDREQALIDRAAGQFAPGTLMTDDDWGDLR